MALLATLHDPRRSDERQPTNVGATVRVDGNPIDALIVNLSASGCLFMCSEPLEVGDILSIGIAGIGRRQARIVRSLDTRFGAEFDQTLTSSEIQTAVAASDESVISFPFFIANPLAHEQEIPINDKYSYRARLFIISLAAITSWFLVFMSFYILYW